MYGTHVVTTFYIKPVVVRHKYQRLIALLQYMRQEGGWPAPGICTVHDRMYGDFPAKNTVCTTCIL
jgi:hypothetical protein